MLVSVFLRVKFSTSGGVLNPLFVNKVNADALLSKNGK
jgi:hypothetical protein